MDLKAAIARRRRLLLAWRKTDGQQYHVKHLTRYIFYALESARLQGLSCPLMGTDRMSELQAYLPDKTNSVPADVLALSAKEARRFLYLLFIG